MGMIVTYEIAKLQASVSALESRVKNLEDYIASLHAEHPGIIPAEAGTPDPTVPGGEVVE